MKIALLRHRVSGCGGAEATLGHLVRGLNATGHEVSVPGTTPEAEAAATLGPAVRYLRVPVWGGKTDRVLSFALNCRRLLPRLGVQVVFSLERTLSQQYSRAGDGCHREWLARRAPYLSALARLAQQVNPFHRTMLWLERRLFSEPNLKFVIGNSRQVREEVEPPLRF